MNISEVERTTVRYLKHDLMESIAQTLTVLKQERADLLRVRC